MNGLYEIAVVVHVVCAMIWVGGVIFMGAVAVPAARKLPEEQRREVTRRLGFAFRPVGWLALALLVATGIYMLYAWGATVENVLNLSFFEAPHLRLLGYKLLAVIAMLIVSGVHDWYLGPRSAKVEPGTQHAEKLRMLASRLGRLTGVLVLVIVCLAVFVARPGLM